MLTLTSAAARQIHQAAAASGAQAMALRIAARQESDGSIAYGMGFDEADENDTQLLLEGVSVLIAERHKALLDDTVLDFVELQPGEFNFIFMEARLAASAPSGYASTGCASGCACGKESSS